jgi:hypothetical protein
MMPVAAKAWLAIKISCDHMLFAVSFSTYISLLTLGITILCIFLLSPGDDC